MNNSTEISVKLILENIAINMLREKMDLKLIASVTEFSIDELLKLKNTI